MSKYTTELRYICEHYSGLTESVDRADVNNVIEQSRSTIFNFDYPIFDTAYKPILERKILKHFYTREISYETVGRWRLALEAKMQEIMPYYNQRYNSELLEFNPLWDTYIDTKHTNDFESERKDVNSRTYTRDIIENEDKQHSGNDVTTLSGSDVNRLGGVDTRRKSGSKTVDEDIDDTSSGTNSKTDASNDWNLYSDTPQGDVTGMSYHYETINGVRTLVAGDEKKYLTNATNDLHEGTQSGSESGTYSRDRDESVNYNEANTTEWGKNDTTQYGKVSTLTYGHKIDTDKLTGIRDSENVNNKRNIDSLESYAEVVLGKRSSDSYSKYLNEFRTTFLNIDMEIIGELETLFMQLW